MSSPPIYSTITAGLLILLQMLLLLDVVRMRWSVRQSLGDGGKKELATAIRRHGNLAENAAIFIACFTLLELIDGRGAFLGALCLGLLIGRALHVIGLSMRRTVNPFRSAGVVMTVLVGVTLGLRLVQVGIAHLSVLGLR
ncbi:MAPEG family protein [Methylovirgula sp. 4M-Z18]|uniref:MAPEG family protein n=1 Tax=Methylovirgula sp. 4M-Z18 TaxID=2293567 RepID=UPI000E2FC68E|nr:MAPEG family protein [Methylovirgula sp. 4M-Z18]RFB79249.1 hypothetical protein DYH55_11770 [Methylovirgula sp. 4M-Z18]